MHWLRTNFPQLLLCLCLLQGAAQASVPAVRVRLFSPYAMPTASLGGGTLDLQIFRGAAIDTLEVSNVSIRSESGQFQFNAEGQWETADSLRVIPRETMWFTGARGIRRRIPGLVVLRPKGSAILAVAVLAMDDYLVGVVHAELGGLTHPELWAAQSAVARTWFARNARKFFEEGECYAVTDDVQSQVFHGWPADEARLAKLQDAVAKTSGLVLVDAEGKCIEALFHANSGGQTMPSAWYFSPRGHLQSQVDSFSLHCPQTYWTKKVDKEAYIAQMARWLKASSSDKAFRMFICTYQQPERAEYLSYGGQKVRLRHVREHFKLRSTWFSVEDGAGTLTLHGRGYGHGIGMSQEGAWEMAKRGYLAEEITAFYYPGTRLVPWVEARW